MQEDPQQPYEGPQELFEDLAQPSEDPSQSCEDPQQPCEGPQQPSEDPQQPSENPSSNGISVLSELAFTDHSSVMCWPCLSTVGLFYNETALDEDEEIDVTL